MRVHEIARDSGISNQNILIALKNLGFEVKNHMSVVDDQTYTVLEKEIRRLKSEPKGETPPAQVKKASEEPKKKKEYIAAFISKDRGFTIWVKRIKTRYIEGEGRQVIPASGERIDFKDYKFQTKNPAQIKFLVERPDFGSRYYPDPSDPTGYWEKEGYYETKTTTGKAPTDKMAALRGEGAKAVKTYAKSVEPALVSQRTT